MHLARIGGAALLLAALAGCYQSRVAVIADGVALPFGEVASCHIGEKPFRLDLTHPERTPGGGALYRQGDETVAFQALNERLYLAQVGRSGLYRYGYVLREGEGVEILALRPEVHTEPAVRSGPVDVLFKPAPDGWQEMVGERANLAAFLTTAKLSMMQSVGRCTFRKAVPPDTPLPGGLRLSTTREQALRLPGAAACDLADVCLPLPLPTAGVPAAERAGVRIQAAFDADRVHAVTVTARGVAPENVKAVLDAAGGAGLSRFGPYASPLAAAVNGGRIDMLTARAQAARDPRSFADMMGRIEKLKDLPTALANPGFGSADMVLLPAETFAAVQGSANAEAAMAAVRARGDPYMRMVFKRSGTGKVDATLELVP